MTQPIHTNGRFGLRTVRSIEHASQVEIVRLDAGEYMSSDLYARDEWEDETRGMWPGGKIPPNIPRRRKRKRTLEEWMQGRPQPVDARWQRAATDLLTHDRNYAWDYAKACDPSPGVAIRFSGGEEPIDVLLCFQCRMISISPPGHLKWGDFDPSARRWLALMQEQFPSDPDLKEIRAHWDEEGIGE